MTLEKERLTVSSSVTPFSIADILMPKERAAHRTEDDLHGDQRDFQDDDKQRQQDQAIDMSRKTSDKYSGELADTVARKDSGCFNTKEFGLIFFK